MKYADLTQDKTSVYISHRLSSTRFCDRIMFIEDGKIMESGSHSELMEKNGLYANMFNIQSHYYQDNIEEGDSYEN
jgi:ATP-binding cassette subfamily B protein